MNSQLRKDPSQIRATEGTIMAGMDKLFEILSSILVVYLLVGLHLHDVATTSTNATSIDSSCPSNRIEAVEAGRQCSRRCRKDMPCENARKQCLCDGLCGMSCLKPDLTCPELPKIDNGHYYPKTNFLNTRVTYQCEPDHSLFGSKERVCQGDEDWSGVPARCLKEHLCLEPPKILHARNPDDGTYQLDDKVIYSCYPGYKPSGIPEAVCRLVEKNRTTWIWAGSPFKCIPESCGDPGSPINGKRHGDSFIIASSVTYSCNDGYELIGQDRRYCQSNNQWSGQAPHCEQLKPKAITCNPTDHIDNGKINYIYPLVFNSTVEYTCDYGFRLVGPRVRECGSKGKLTSDVPRCEEIDCGDPGPLDNGRIIGASTKMGDKKEFVCSDGITFVGKYRETVCLESGGWSNPLPKCLAPCSVQRVEASTHIYAVPPLLLEQIQKENVTLQEVDVGSVVVHGTFLEVTCEKNFELDEQMDNDSIIQYPRCNNGTWSYQAKCKPASCSSRSPSLKNGRIRIVSMEHNSKAFLHCLDGFRLKGNNVIYCNKGNWSEISGSCVEVFCGFPGHIEHGRVSVVGLNGMYDYRPYIKKMPHNRQISYECDTGYHMNEGASSGATCMDGHWKPNGLPNCIKE